MPTKEDIKTYRKAYYQKNKVDLKASQKAYKQTPEGRASYKASRKAYRQSPKGKASRKAERKAYYQTPAGKFIKYKDNARTRKINWLLTYEEFIAFWQKPCSYCGDKIETIGLDRVDNLKGYQIDNIISCCKVCNRMKMKQTKEEFENQCKKICLHL